MIRNFSVQDIKAVAKLCRLNMEYDIMPDFLLHEKTFEDPDYDPELAIVSEDENTGLINGFILGIIRHSAGKNIAFVKIIVVESNIRRNGLATQLYKELEQRFVSKRVVKILIAESIPNFLTPGVDDRYLPAVSFFSKLGFQITGESFSLAIDLQKSDIDLSDEITAIKQDGYSISEGNNIDIDALSQLAGKFRTGYNHFVKIAAANTPPTTICVNKDDRIVAVSLFECNNKGTGFFGIFLFHPDLTDKKIIKVIIGLTIIALKSLGYVKGIACTIHSKDIYSLIPGFYIERKFLRFKKEME